MTSSETYEFLFVKTGDHEVIKNEKPPGNTQKGRHEYCIDTNATNTDCIVYLY